MAATLEGTIMELLFARVANLVLTPVHAIAWPNVSFDPPASQKFLRVVFVPNVVNRALIDSDGPHQRLGLLQVSVHAKINDGEAGVRDVAGAVAAHFPADLKLTHATGVRVRITEPANVADLIVEDARVQIPVTVQYECWA